jgi:hypothetical protein
MGNESGNESMLSKDPTQLRWAVDDLRVVTEYPWLGGKVVISADDFYRTREASTLIVDAVTNGDLVLGEPIITSLREAEEDIEGSQLQISELTGFNEARAAEAEELRQRIKELEEDKKNYRAGYKKLNKAISKIIDNLGSIEAIGNLNPFDEIIEELKETSNEAFAIVPDDED